MAEIKLVGIKELSKKLKSNVTLDDVRRVVRHNGAELQTRMQQNADFKKGYQTGATKQSIGLELKGSGMTAVVGPETEYSPYLEYGTRFMEAQPFVRPAFDAQVQQFKKDMDKLAK